MDNGAVEEISLIVFADGAVVGQHPGITALPQGLSCVVVSGQDIQACVARSFVDDYGEIETGEGSYLVTATLRCLGLRVRPGGTVALLRASTSDQASIIFHQASDDAPVPPDASNTAVVADWPGSAWAESARVLAVPDASPPPDWPVNAALRALGVKRGDSPDEATAISLPVPTP